MLKSLLGVCLRLRSAFDLYLLSFIHEYIGDEASIRLQSKNSLLKFHVSLCAPVNWDPALSETSSILPLCPDKRGGTVWSYVPKPQSTWLIQIVYSNMRFVLRRCNFWVSS